MPGRSAVVSLLVVLTGLVLAAPAFAPDIADASPPSGTVGVPYRVGSTYGYELATSGVWRAPGRSRAGGTLPAGIS
jgi:hypothetical protein